MKFIAGWALSNHGGVGVIEMTDESMTIQYYDDEPETVEIKYDYSTGDSYVEVGQIILRLNECMRY